MAVRQFKDGRWAVAHRDPAKRQTVYEYFGRGPAAKQAAEERDLEIKLLKKRGKLAPLQEAVYLDNLAQAYLKDAAMRGKSKRFRDEFAAILNVKVLPGLCYRPVDELTYAEVLEFATVTWGHLSLASRQRYLGYLRAVFRFGLRHGMTNANPLAGWSRQKEPRLDFKLTVDDLQKIMDAAPPHLAWALEVEWELGTRPGVTELFALRWDDVDLDAGLVRVRGSKTEGSDRLVSLTPGFAERLRERRKTARSAFLIEYAGRPIKSIKKGLKSAVLKAGISYNVRPYDIRHLFASVMLAGGGDLAAVSKLLGHATINTTAAVYYHPLQGEKARATALRPAIRKAGVGQSVGQNEKPSS